MATESEIITQLNRYIFQKLRYKNLNNPTVAELKSILESVLEESAEYLQYPTSDQTLFLKWNLSTQKIDNLTAAEMKSALDIEADKRIPNGDATHLILYWNQATSKFVCKTLAEIRTALEVVKIDGIGGVLAEGLPVWSVEEGKYVYELWDNFRKRVPHSLMFYINEAISVPDQVYSLLPCMNNLTDLVGVPVIPGCKLENMYITIGTLPPVLVELVDDLFVEGDKIHVSAILHDVGEVSHLYIGVVKWKGSEEPSTMGIYDVVVEESVSQIIVNVNYV